MTIRKLVVEEPDVPEQQEQVYEKVSERVERFTIEQIDNEIANLQTRIDELKAKKSSAVALEEVRKWK